MQIKILRSASWALLATSSLLTLNATAAEYTVSTPTFLKNGSAGNILDGDDSITVTSTGSITTAASTALDASNANNSVTNLGTVTTTGFAHGIRVDEQSKITNVGSVTVNANNSVGVFAQNLNTILNSGTITTKGNNGWGISFQNSNTVTNSGTISTLKINGRGISGNNSNTITNSGSIQTVGTDAYGIEANNLNSIDNSGAITTAGIRAYALYIDDNNVISNSGTLKTTGADTSAVVAKDNNNITNSGIINTSADNSNGMLVHNNNSISNTGSIKTAGILSVGMAGEEGNSLTNNGDITTSGQRAYGLLAAGANNTLVNGGTIKTTGPEAHGISLFQTNTTAANSGTILVEGANSFGIASAAIIMGPAIDVNNTLTNSGTITTTGSIGVGMGAANFLTNKLAVNNSGTININNGGAGIVVLANSTVSNSGTINTKSNSTVGIFANGNLNIINISGDINTSGDATSNAVFVLGNGNKLTNSGNLSTSGSDSPVVTFLGIENIFTNSGTVLASSSNASSHGVLFNTAGNTLNNSGKIVSTAGSAIISVVGDSTINLNAPSYLGGDLSFQGGDLVNITTGRSHSDSWFFSGGPVMNFNGPVPWAWNAVTEQFTTLDPTALSAAPDVLAQNVTALSELARTNNQPDEWWLKGYGNFGQYAASGVNNEYAALSGGMAAGMSFTLSDNLDLGAFVGYQASNINVNSRWMTSQTISGKGVSGGLYSTVHVDNMFADLALYAGWSANSSDRFINDNLQPLGVDHALADFNSFFLAPEVRLGLNIATDGSWVVTPSAAARLAYQWNDGYTETGSNANATVGARTIQVFEGQLELAATRKLDSTELTVRGGIDYRQNLGATAINVSLQGQTLAEPLKTSGTFGGYIGLDVNHPLSDKLSLDISTNAGYSAGGSYNLAGSVGISGLF